MYRVIIVEDDPVIARGTKGSVEQNSEFQVKAIFSNGQEALNYIWLNPVDLIVLDLYMPQMNGKEFLYRLRRENLLVDVIVVTAANEGEDIRDVLPFGIVDYLLKPFTTDRFNTALERFEQRHNIMNAISGLDQSGIDKMFTDHKEVDAATHQAHLMEKGLNIEHYDVLLKIMREHADQPFTAEHLAEQSKISRIAVRRYLNELIEAREITSDVVSGGKRPVMLYRLREEGKP